MDEVRFDALSRRFAQGRLFGATRRAALGATLAAALARLLPHGPAFAQRPVRLQACDAGAAATCVARANQTLESEILDCQDLPRATPQSRAACQAAARRRHDAAVRSCDTCPVGSRCDSGVCCPSGQASCASVCHTQRQGSSVAFDFSLTRGGLTLVHHRSYDVATGDGGFSTNVINGTDPLVLLDIATTRAGARNIRVNYGAAVTGLRGVTLNLVGGMVQGNIDGRTIVPFAAAAPPASLAAVAFADGKPPPVLGMAPALSEGLRRLLEAQRTTDEQDCARPARPPRPPRPADNLGNTHLPASHDEPHCDECESNCTGSLYETCIGGGLATIFFCPPCAAAIVSGCLSDATLCTAGCYLPGNGCCPVLCGTPIIDNCCGFNETCLHDHDVCCPSTLIVCGKDCCDPGIGNCAPNGTCGCPAGSMKCNGVCCPEGQSCCGGQCCAAGSCFNDVCCQAPQHMCGGTCCPPFNACCNNVCCGTDDLCIGNRECCPRDRVCGQVCCPAGQFCQDAAAGTCSACPPGLVACTSVMSGRTVSTCCPPGANCCLGVCCSDATGHECNGARGCGTIG